MTSSERASSSEAARTTHTYSEHVDPGDVVISTASDVGPMHQTVAHGFGTSEAPGISVKTWLQIAALAPVFLIVVVRAAFGPSDDRSVTWSLAVVAALAVFGGVVIWLAESRRRTTCSQLRARARDIAAGAVLP